MKKFNTTGLCVPEKHYMADITERIEKIGDMVDEGKYFTICRARQYGKTTTLAALEQFLREKYIVVSLDFQDLGSACYDSEYEFAKSFTMIFSEEYCHKVQKTDPSYQKMQELEKMAENAEKELSLLKLFRKLREICDCAQKPIVLMIDEVDSAADKQVFLDFLAQLRSLYLKREKTMTVKTFQSVILAGVTDVKHLKSKVRDEEQHKVNSPWNIASDFLVDMNLLVKDIKGMLDAYESDHHTGMDTEAVAKEIYEYTNGYPFLVSRLCQLMDEQLFPEMFENLVSVWTRQGIDEAVKLLLSETNTLFESLFGKLVNYPELKETLKGVLMEGNTLTYNAMQESIVQMQMYGFVRNSGGKVVISNRIFETLLYNLFLSDEELKNNTFVKEGSLARNIFVTDGKLNVRLILEKFIVTYEEVFGPLNERFKEKDGREQFLLYLKPIINGTGNYYIEAQTRDQTRTDVIVDYLGQRYVIELKIWRGARYNEDGERQLKGYLDYFGLDVGYMLSFNFNKKKEVGVKRVNVGDKVLFEGTV